MRIRLINQYDWEKAFDFDKSIIRVGSQANCDIQLDDVDISPLHIQFMRVGGETGQYQMRFFAGNGLLIRGGQQYELERVTPYDILDGDSIGFSSYRIMISLDDEKTRIRTSPHIAAQMFMNKRELSPESPINGLVTLKNTGTEQPCQFAMRIQGIPSECMESAPLPYLHPGQSSMVGFVITHLETKPAPGFHTISITINAPEQYFGEVLEFNQDIYVTPVFKTDFVLEDDSAQLTGFNNSIRKEAENQKKNEEPNLVIKDHGLMNPDDQAAVSSDASADETPVVVISGKDGKNNAFDQSDSDGDTKKVRKTRRSEKVIVFGGRNRDENAFDDDPEQSKSKESESETNKASVTSADDQKPSATIDAENTPAPEKPIKKKKKTKPDVVAETAVPEKTTKKAIKMSYDAGTASRDAPVSDVPANKDSEKTVPVENAAETNISQHPDFSSQTELPQNSGEDLEKLISAQQEQMQDVARSFARVEADAERDGLLEDHSIAGDESVEIAANPQTDQQPDQTVQSDQPDQQSDLPNKAEARKAESPEAAESVPEEANSAPVPSSDIATDLLQETVEESKPLETPVEETIPEVQPVSEEIAAESVPVPKTPEKKTNKPNVPVVHRSSDFSFDEPTGSENVPPADTTGSAKVRIVKGGGFDD